MMSGSGPQVPPTLNAHEFGAVHAAGVGMVPHQLQDTPADGVQLTKFSCWVSVVQPASAHDSRIAVLPVRVALVKQLGNVLVGLVLPLTILTDRATVSLATRRSPGGPGRVSPGSQVWPCVGEI